MTMTTRNLNAGVNHICAGVRILPYALLALVAVASAPVSAFECMNGGAGATSNDHGDLSRTACGSGADAKNFGTTALGLGADAAGNNSTVIGGAAGTTAAFSLAIGAQTDAVGARASAVGADALAEGDSATAVGYGAVTTANYGVAVGSDASANGVHAIAIGYEAGTNDGEATSIGRAAFAAGSSSIALGHNASTGGNSSTALGHNASAVGAVSLALGQNASAAGGASIALGRNASAGFRAVAIGRRALANQPDTIVLGSSAGVNFATEYTDVAIGTTTPLAPLHIARGLGSSPGNAQLLVDNIDQPTTEPRSMLELINNGPIGFNMENVDTGQRWRFAAQTTGFRISLAGTGGPELEVRDNGNAVLAGNLFTNSDVNAKQDIVPVAGASVLEKLERLPVSEWSYKDATGTRHLGPMAQDFHAAFGLGPNDTSIAPMDLAGVSMAAVKALQQQFHRKLVEKDAHIAALETHTTELERRLKVLEALVLGPDANVAVATAR